MYKNEFEPYHERPSFQAVKKATDALKEVSGKLLLDLENHRQSLCRTYDIPAAPISAEEPQYGCLQRLKENIGASY